MKKSLPCTASFQLSLSIERNPTERETQTSLDFANRFQGGMGTVQFIHFDSEFSARWPQSLLFCTLVILLNSTIHFHVGINQGIAYLLSLILNAYIFTFYVLTYITLPAVKFVKNFECFVTYVWHGFVLDFEQFLIM